MIKRGRGNSGQPGGQLGQLSTSSTRKVTNPIQIDPNDPNHKNFNKNLSNQIFLNFFKSNCTPKNFQNFFSTNFEQKFVKNCYENVDVLKIYEKNIFEKILEEDFESDQANQNRLFEGILKILKSSNLNEQFISKFYTFIIKSLFF